MEKLNYIKVIKNFLSNNEVNSLNEWTLNNFKSEIFIDPKMNHDNEQTRYTTRHTYLRKDNDSSVQVKYPKESYIVQNKILKYLNLSSKNIAPLPYFFDGISTTISFSPGGCVKHIDPIYYSNTYTLHCNFITQYPKDGGVTIIDDKYYKTNSNDMLMYITSHAPHACSPGKGDIPRILWVYAMVIEKYQLIKIFNNLNYE
jgi:hypothetical protein